MSTNANLPAELSWRQELDQHTLYLDGIPVVRVEPMVRGLMVRTLIHGPRLSVQETMVRSVDRGKALAHRWATARLTVIRETCSNCIQHGIDSKNEPSESPSIARWLQT